MTVISPAKTTRVKQALADALNTSRRTLERRFEEVVGRSVYSEIARLRAEYVKRQLIETERPLNPAEARAALNAFPGIEVVRTLERQSQGDTSRAGTDVDHQRARWQLHLEHALHQ